MKKAEAAVVPAVVFPEKVFKDLVKNVKEAILLHPALTDPEMAVFVLETAKKAKLPLELAMAYKAIKDARKEIAEEKEAAAKLAERNEKRNKMYLEALAVLRKNYRGISFAKPLIVDGENVPPYIVNHARDIVKLENEAEEKAREAFRNASRPKVDKKLGELAKKLERGSGKKQTPRVRKNTAPVYQFPEQHAEKKVA